LTVFPEHAAALDLCRSDRAAMELREHDEPGGCVFERHQRVVGAAAAGGAIRTARARRRFGVVAENEPHPMRRSSAARHGRLGHPTSVFCAPLPYAAMWTGSPRWTAKPNSPERGILRGTYSPQFPTSPETSSAISSS